MHSNAVVSIFFKSVRYQTKPPSDDIYRRSSTIFKWVVLIGREGGREGWMEGGMDGWKEEGKGERRK